MTGDQDMKHSCRICGKSFPSGRSLGGHMRSHVVAISSPMSSPAPQGAGYVLRENRKKSWRLDDAASPQSEKLCRECGKGFPSWNSLFGHMRCHVDRSSRGLDEEEEEEEDEVEGSWSDNEGDVVARRKRRRRSRRVAAIPASSSSVSEYEKEQEEVAYSLMMLSRDVGFWGGASSVAESSDKHSDFSANWAEKGSELMKKAESDFSDTGFASDDNYDEFNQPSRKKNKNKNKNLVHEGVTELKRKARTDDYESFVEMPRPLSKKGKLDADVSSLGYECSTCKKIFATYQALGGHRASHHKKIKDVGENSLDTEDGFALPSSSRKGKKHECPICHKVFVSGQALGGHKRSHMVASSSHSIVIQQEQLPIPPLMPDLIDLNLPAPVDEASISSDHSWWVHKPMVGVIDLC